MPEIEKSAEQATEIAVEFLKGYYPVSHKPLSAKFQKGRVVAEDKWVVEVDVGTFYPRVATVTLAARSGKILTYEVERSESPPAESGQMRP